MDRTIDFLIISLYLILIAFIGLYKGGRQKSTKDYFLGADKVPWWAVTFSIVAAETSSLTFISIPGLAYIANLNFLQLALGFLIGRIIVASLLLPQYFKGELTTAYSFLGERFGSKTRSLSSLVFLFTRLLADGVRLFATAIPLKLLLGIDYPVAILIIAGITLLYTITGGVKGIIWVDVVQMSVYIGGAVISLYFLVSFYLPDGFNTLFASDVIKEKFEIINLGTFQTFFSDPYTLLGGIIGGTFLSMASHGTDQLIVQRLLATKDLANAKKAVITSGVAVFFQFALFLFIGIALYGFYGVTELRSDEVFPKFIIDNLPVGITGIIIAGLFAAAMSSLAGSISSLSSSVFYDLLPNLFNKQSESINLTYSRFITLLWTVLLVLAALLFMNTTQAVVELALSIASFTYGGLLGTFLLGIFNKRISQNYAIAAFLTGIIGMILFISVDLVAWTWYTLVGVIITLLTGYLLSFYEHSIKTNRKK
ncbi:MAG: sodium:solute symporter [Melioribacteraceae bacterium]|nr:sodium:solute symporter [Melioribacteraceae bacterium]